MTEKSIKEDNTARYKKLPKWVQQELSRLKADVNYLISYFNETS